MSAVTPPESSIKIAIFADYRGYPFTFGCGVSLVIFWSGSLPKTASGDGKPTWCEP
jgi:hypothetical protein